ncbi:MAG: GNAT family N-acetyltransferase [Actinomycetota bacterium]|nr:GNAT family N-acetyltransferase [Actinomycetota bacterium]
MDDLTERRRSAEGDVAAKAEANLWASWFAALGTSFGERYGAKVVEFGDAVTVTVPEIPRTYYNRVFHLGGRDVEQLDDIVRWYTGQRTPFRVDIAPSNCDEDLLAAFDSYGFRIRGFQSVLRSTPTAVMPGPPAGVLVREVRRDEIGYFCDLYESAYFGGVSGTGALARFREDGIRARSEDPRWRFYLAFVDDAPAAGAIAFFNAGVASLAGAATLPTQRGRGCQTALLHRRIADAHASGCALVVSRCTAGSISQRNMERAGLQVAYTKLIWEYRSDHVTLDLPRSARSGSGPELLQALA